MPTEADTPVQFVKGIGPGRADALANLGIHTALDLIEYMPFRYEEELGEVAIEDLRAGVIATIRGEVIHARRSGDSLTVEVADNSGQCKLRWFNAPQASLGTAIGAMIAVTGKVSEFDLGMQFVQPMVRVLDDGRPRKPGDKPASKPPPPGVTPPRLVGVYASSARIQSLTIRQVIHSLLDQQPPLSVEVLPEPLVTRHGLLTRRAAIELIHRPRRTEDIEQARRRLAYEEFLLVEAAMALRRRRLLQTQSAAVLRSSAEIDRRIRARFPFKLTAAQDRVIAEIARDLKSGRPMTRLLQGDVGSGKTVVALHACLTAVASHRQAVILAPTEILAEQHFLSIESFLAGSRVRRALLRGGMAQGERDQLRRTIEAGEMDLIVGTQALLEREVAFRDLGLVVVDEQHKFGVLQRFHMRTKGPSPHYLVMTATPIPRTLAMTVFGDLDVSVLDGSPPGRGKVVTKVVTPRQWPTVMTYVRKRLDAGEQAYVVCPRIGEDGQPTDEPEAPTRDETVARPPRASAAGVGVAQGGKSAGPKGGEVAELISVRDAFERLSKGPLAGLPLAMLHGGMSSREKRETIDAFRAGKLAAIVATTVVEVGVDVPNAAIMVVEHAERFGLAQLHQLRGRVGRGSRESLCVLISYASARRPARTRVPTEQREGSKAQERLAALAATTDGFRIAEADLRLRGPGELLGTRQHGLPELRFGRLDEDFEMLETARRDGFELIAADPTLSRPEHAGIRSAMRRLFKDKLALIDAG